MEPKPKGPDFNRSLAKQPDLIDQESRELLEQLEIDSERRQELMRQQIRDVAEGGTGIVFVDLSED